MKVNLNKLSYNFDKTGVTTSVTAELTTQDTYPEYLNARFEITTNDLETGQSFEDLSRKQLEKYTCKKLLTAITDNSTN